MLKAVLIAVIIVAGLGLLVGIVLGIVAKALAVPVDEKEEAIRACLPGNNCGGCGYAGCDGLAAAIAKGEAPAGQCPVGGPECAAKIAAITGGSAEVEKKVAFVKCQGTCETASVQYQYSGLSTCREAATMVGGGPKSCANGCLGLGSCVAACRFGALEIRNGVAFVKKDECMGCAACVQACPKHLIELVPFDQKVIVRCSSTAKGKDVRAVCKSGCIGCGLCAKNCPNDAIAVENNLAKIDASKCTACGLCAGKCPAKCIVVE